MCVVTFFKFRISICGPQWLLPCIPNTCKITGATQRPFPTQRPLYTFLLFILLLNLFFVSILSRVNELFTKCRWSPHSVRFVSTCGEIFFPSTLLRARSVHPATCALPLRFDLVIRLSSTLNWPDCDLSPFLPESFLHSKRGLSSFTVHHVPSNSHLTRHLSTGSLNEPRCHSTRDCPLGIR